MAGGRIDVEVAADLSEFNSQFEQGLEGAGDAASNFAGKIAGVLAFTGAAVSFASVIDKGNEFTRTLNAMSGVTGATGEQMDVIKAKAMALGNDVELSATSANDAAAAMTELAKGGFSVDQSMEAAKGTLQLAAAAQIDAAEAATIQSQALQAFGLDASYAATASDVLANAANASSAEITDIAAGLQQSGTVANGFGVSMEDTATMLGLFANAGITGSDAGTLLKSSLLALTDQGKPAQAAIEELGLTVYDAQDKFVGMRSLFEQLSNASKNMSQEQFQAATATLFGSDAIRQAMVAAEGGVEKYDAMRLAIGRQGAAAELAAAQNQGLPGVFEKIENTSERLQLQLYDLIDGPLTSFGNATVGLADGALDKFDVALGNSGGVLVGLNDVILNSLTGLPILAGIFDDVVSSGQSLWAIATDIGGGLGSLAGGALKSGGALDVLQTALSGVTASVSIVFNAIEPIVGVVATAAGAFGALPAPIQAVVTGLVALKLASMASSAFMARNTDGMGRMATAAHGLGTRIQGVGPGLRAAGSNVAAFGSAVRTSAQMVSQANPHMSTFGRTMTVLTAQSSGLTSMRTAFTGAATGATRFSGALAAAQVAGRGMVTAAGSMVSALGGGLMIGIVAATVAITQISRASADMRAQQQAVVEGSNAVGAAQRDMAKEIQAANGAVSDAVTAAVAMQVDAIQTEQKKLADAKPSKFWSTIKDNFQDDAKGARDATDAAIALGEQAERINTSFSEVGLTSAELSGKITGTDAAFRGLVGSLEGTSNGGADAVAEMQALRDKFVAAEKSAKDSTPGFFDLTEAVRVLGDESSSSADRVSAIKTALDVLSGKAIPLSDAVQQYNKTLRETAEAAAAGIDPAKGFGDALVGEGGVLSTATSNGSALRDSLTGITSSTVTLTEATISAALEQGKSLPEAQAAARAAMAQNETALQNLAKQYDQPIWKIKEWAAAEGLLPDQIIMLASLSGATDVEQQISVISAMLKGVGQPVDIPVDALTDEAKRKLLDTGATVDAVTGKPGIVRVTAPNQQALDQIRAVQLARDGLQDKTVTISVQYNSIRDVALAYGPGSPEAWAEMARQQQISGRALGGPIEGGIPGKDSVPILAMPGEHMLTTADVDSLGGQEGVFRFRAALAQGKVGKFADGGAIGSDGLDNMINFARAKAGIGYDYGPWDCSMYMSHIAATGMGQQARRLWTTYSILGGDLQGMQPGGSEGHFRIGVSQEHMAGTLFFKDGSRVDVENGGSNSGSTFGGNAAGYDDSQFPAQFHLPDSALSPALQMALTGGSGASYSGGVAKEPWTEKDALALESARVAVIQAKEAQDKVNANEKKSDADRQQAELKVQRAELKVRELEGKRDGTGSGKAIGPAPELAGAMTDDAISLRNAEIAVVDAQLARDKTYAAAESTSIDREKADIAVFSATNALEKAKAGDGAKTFNLKDRVKSYGTDVVGILVDAAFEQLPSALSESRWITTDWEGLMGVKPKPVAAAPSFSQAEIDAQLPATPGAPGWQTAIASVAGDDWQKRLADALNMPTVLRDGGGPVPHGTAALNLSGAEEWMLTADERLNLSRDFALMRGATNRGGDGASLDLSGLMSQVDRLVEHADRPNVTYQTRDIDAALRQDRLDRRKQSLTFSRR
ncbi:phage tail tape measure protein [Rhodococcus sp. IEGM 1409]|uniref:phage tail tape measure protein n=1 Tax=Rhodococcus sp. IEGM 1409 TaxID=3047082 RepID=UPI0024B7014F|nr:phage tail tape measure protein [Rhodococcus sp. IEGM 1409]MDI9900261.1 phage tail tape measure protein [Rhodococcus sp. IEGM 1409]